MRDGIAEIIAEAQAQLLDLADVKDWRRVVSSIDGYEIAKELGLNFHIWGGEQFRLWKAEKRWELVDMLHLRIMLFYVERANYFAGGYSDTIYDDMEDSLLHEISKWLDLPYDKRKG